LVPVPSIVPGAVFHHDFGLAVSIEVIDQVLGVVCAGSNVGPQVDPPKLLSVQVVRIQEYIAGAAAL